jgi:hypothetical protein
VFVAIYIQDGHFLPCSWRNKKDMSTKIENKLLLQKQMELGMSGSHLQSNLLRRQRSGRSWFKASPSKLFMRPTVSQKNPHKNTVAQVVENLPTKHETLISNPVPPKTK